MFQAVDKPYYIVDVSKLAYNHTSNALRTLGMRIDGSTPIPVSHSQSIISKDTERQRWNAPSRLRAILNLQKRQKP